MPRALAAMLVLGLVVPGDASAWGNQGHEIVCSMALDLLEPPEREQVVQLATQYATPAGDRYDDFPTACTFADRARRNARKGYAGWKTFNRFNDWHFLNAPRSARQVAESHCGDDCVLTAIAYHSAVLADPANDPQRRGRALLFLAHWIGDIHQPLHVSYADDQGGNLVAVDDEFYTDGSMHAVWDTGIIAKARGDRTWQEYAALLGAAITPAMREQWRSGTPLDWARESYEISTSESVQYCTWHGAGDEEVCAPSGSTRRLDAAYQQQFHGDVERRLQQAAVRLAEALHRALEP